METFLLPGSWRGYRRPDFPQASWTVRGDILQALPGGERVSLVSRDTYGDFDLSLEWRVPPGGNSGILYRVTEEDDAPWQSGPEMQLLDDAEHPDGRVPETACGALYGLYAPRNAPLCAPGIFNVARVSVHGSRIEHWLNGVRVLEGDMASEDFRARVARSKFRDFPRFARAARGHIVLQHHGSAAAFYNIRIDADL